MGGEVEKACRQPSKIASLASVWLLISDRSSALRTAPSPAVSTSGNADSLILKYDVTSMMMLEDG